MGPAAGAAPGENPLAFLRDHEMFQQIRSVIQQNPNMLSTMLQQIGQSNPQLLQIISQNQEAFIRMINEGEAGEGGGVGGVGAALVMPLPLAMPWISLVSSKSLPRTRRRLRGWKRWVSLNIWWFRLTLPVRRMRTLRPISCSRKTLTTKMPPYQGQFLLKASTTRVARLKTFTHFESWVSACDCQCPSQAQASPPPQ